MLSNQIGLEPSSSRLQVLLEMPEDALRALPDDIAAEAQAIRERAAEAKFDPSLHLRYAGLF